MVLPKRLQRHFGEDLVFEQPECMHRGDNKCVFRIVLSDLGTCHLMTDKIEMTEQDRLAKRLAREQRARAESEMLAEGDYVSCTTGERNAQLL